jgi:hypothetical protein
MKKKWNSVAAMVLIACLSLLSIWVKAQVTKPLNVIVPGYIIDERGKLHKSIGGMDFNVRITIDAGVKYLDGCSNESFGELHTEIIWYNANDETGRVMLQMMKDLNAVEQDKQSFLGAGSIREFAGGSLILTSSEKACVNEITGPTGKTEYNTDARYFAFNGFTTTKISISSKIKPETVQSILSYMVEQIAKTDFSIYKTTIVDEVD